MGKAQEFAFLTSFPGKADNTGPRTTLRTTVLECSQDNQFFCPINLQKIPERKKWKTGNTKKQTTLKSWLTFSRKNRKKCAFHFTVTKKLYNFTDRLEESIGHWSSQTPRSQCVVLHSNSAKILSPCCYAANNNTEDAKRYQNLWYK